MKDPLHLPITLEEIRRAIIMAMNSKTPGTDDLCREILKLIDEDNLKILKVVFNNIYSNTGIT